MLKLKELMLKLKCQYFGHLMRTPTDWKRKTEGKRRRKLQRRRWLDSITEAMDANMSKLQETVKDRGAVCALVIGSPRVGYNLATEHSKNKFMKMIVLI